MSSLKTTIGNMCSKNYKQRFIAEYKQVSIRYEKLKAMLEKWDRKELDFIPTCPRYIYNFQMLAMKNYMLVLKTRADMEGIDLYDYTDNINDLENALEEYMNEELR